MEVSTCNDCKNGSKCFKLLLNDELSFIDQNKVQTLYHKGETICKTGSFANTIIYIIEGLVKVYLEGPGKKNLGVMMLKGGDYIGLTTLYETNAYYYSASALTETNVCSINKDSFKDLISKNALFGAEIIQWYCKNYGALYGKLDSIGFKHLNGRVADVLLNLDGIVFNEKNIHSFLSRKDLADMAGIPVGSAIRILSEFSDAKIIKLKTKQITITDKAMLEKISRGG